MDEVNRYVEDKTDHRYYDDGQRREPSVTTILSIKDSDNSGLEGWKAKYDGKDGMPYHGHIFWYARNRGTLAHWHALSQLGDVPWSADERSSRHELFYQNDENGDLDGSSPREVLYSVMKYHNTIDSWGDFYDRHPPYKPSDYYRKQLLSYAARDVQYFRETFEQLVDDLGISEDDVIRTEEYLVNHKYHYAGQIDLLVEYGGDVVAADLKTSSSNRDKNKLQLAAYSKAVELDDNIPVDHIDRTEVWRIHPDSGTYTIHSNERATDLHDTSYWNESRDAAWTQFLDLANKFFDNHYTRYKE